MTWASHGQLSLLEDPLDVRFAQWHQDNPHVYAALVILAREWKAAGNDVCSMDLLFNRLRWDYGLRGEGDQFALNNSYRSRYSRLIEANERDLIGFFTKRRLATDWDAA